MPRTSDVTLKLYNLSGREVKRTSTHSGIGYHEVNIPLDILHRGIYFVEMRADDYRGVKKIVVIK